MDDGKGARVTGFFIFLTGAGIILDSNADALGALIAFAGAGMIAFGLAKVRRSGVRTDIGSERS